MHFLSRILLLLTITFFPIVASAADQQVLKTKMLSDLDIIQNAFEVKYAPAEWKKSYANWELGKKINEAKTRVVTKNPISVKDYQRILRSFFNSPRDCHVAVFFHSTACSFLPFRVEGAQNRYFIAWVDKSANLPLQVGDEVITFDGKPIAEVINTLRTQELGNPQSLTDRSKAEFMLTGRLGACGLDTPTGPVTLNFKHANSNKMETLTLNWICLPEEINNRMIERSAMAHAPLQFDIPRQPQRTEMADHSFFHKPMCWSLHDTQKAFYHKAFLTIDKDDDDSVYPIAAKKSFVPLLGNVTWEAPTAALFHAYIFKMPNQKTVGYIRIPDYMGGMKPTAGAAEFLSLIKIMEERTDALVIDQVNNPGGDVFYMYALASMLAKTPLQLPTHRVTITQGDVLYALDSLRDFPTLEQHIAGDSQAQIETEETISGYPITQEFLDGLKRHFQFIIDEWNAGRTFTRPDYLYGVTSIAPHKTCHYTKPILVLANQMSISCGDFFPAMLQDNQRAKIFGVKTAGAGGYVLGHSHPNRFGIAFYTLTGSLVERANHEPIENLGVTPDLIYEITPQDLQNNYNGYVSAVLRALDNLLK